MRFVGFSARLHHENQKTHVFFWFFNPKTKKHSAKPKKPKIQSKPKDSLPDFGFLVFWFRVVLLSRKIVGSRLPKQMAVYVGVVIEKKRFLC